MASNRGRTGKAWRDARNRVLATETHCAWCGQPVDKRLSGRHRDGPSIDHTWGLDEGGPLLHGAELHLMHNRCNTAKSNRSRAQRNQGLVAALNPSRQW